MSKRLKRSLAVIAVLAVIGGIVGLVALLREHQKEARYDANIDQAIAMMGLSKKMDFDTRLDTIRRFINDNSRHLMDKQFWRLHAEGDNNVYLTRVLAHAEGKSDQRAHMECSTRSNLTRNILWRLGYEVRIVSIFDTDNPSKDKSHTFVEVKNPKTGAWETQDPDYDIYWKSLVTGKRVAISETAGDLSKVVPCGETHCGWDVRGRDGQRASRLKGLLDIIVVTRKEIGLRYAVYTPRANPKAIFTRRGKSGTFCQVNAKRCKDGFVPIAEQAALKKKLAGAE